MTDDQKMKCKTIIHSHAAAAAVGNAVPVPGLGIATDMVTMTSMCMVLCGVFGGSLTEEAAKEILQNPPQCLVHVSMQWHPHRP